MYFTIYKITNTINGKYYIGKHQTKIINDGYFGSGIYLERAIKIHGKENFYKEILYIFDNKKKMDLAEKILVVIDTEVSYNIAKGGIGGFDYINMIGASKGANNIMVKNPDIAKKVNENKNKTRSLNPEYYSQIGKENIKKAHAFNKGKVRPKHSEFMKERSHLKNLQKNHKEKFRDILSSWFMITSPSGEFFRTNRLEDFCNELGLGYNALWNSSRTNNVVTKGKSKGWICQKI